MKYLFIFTFLNLLGIILCQDQNLMSFIKSLEYDVQEMSKRIESLFQTRCSAKWKKSFHSCSDQLPEFTCQSDFKMKDCDCMKIQGTMLNPEKTVVKVQNKNFPYPDLTDQKVREMITSFSQVDEEFFKLKQKYSLNIKWQYIGTYLGIHHLFPAQEYCKQYDPRGRPWYILAATGSKNLILVIDISKSMDLNNRFINAKNAASKIINSLTSNDWINVVIFSDAAVSLFPTLNRATPEIRANATSYIENLYPTGQTNYEAAIRTTFNVLSNTKADESGSACQSIIMFLTDGEPTLGETDSDNLVKIIQNLDKFNTIWFGYAFGFNSEPSTLIKITCARNGITELIPDGEKIDDAMMSYHILFSSGLQRDKTVWTEPYEDAFGLGMMVTAAFPLYDRSREIPFLIGVYGVDVVISEFLKYQGSDQVIKSFLGQSQKCSNFLLNNCQMESMRKFKCSNNAYINPSSTCNSIQKYHSVCKNDIFEDVFIEKTNIMKNLSIQKCCSSIDICLLDIGLVVGPTVAGVILIIVITIIACKYCNNPKICQQCNTNVCSCNNTPNNIPTNNQNNPNTENENLNNGVNNDNGGNKNIENNEIIVPIGLKRI